MEKLRKRIQNENQERQWNCENQEEEILSLKFNDWIFASTKSWPTLASSSRTNDKLVSYLFGLGQQLPVLWETVQKHGGDSFEILWRTEGYLNCSLGHTWWTLLLVLVHTMWFYDIDWVAFWTNLIPLYLYTTVWHLLRVSFKNKFLIFTYLSLASLYKRIQIHYHSLNFLVAYNLNK